MEGHESRRGLGGRMGGRDVEGGSRGGLAPVPGGISHPPGP